MSEDWTGMIAGERMQLDQEFADRVEASSFNRQQWGLVMTALDFEIEDPATPDQARLVPDTSSVPTIIPELDNLEQPGAMGGASQSSESGGGLMDSVKGALGLGGGGGGSDQERLDEATDLATDYCERLQERLESSGRWESVCQRAQG